MVVGAVVDLGGMTEGVLLQGDLATGVAGEIGQGAMETVGVTGGIADAVGLDVPKSVPGVLEGENGAIWFGTIGLHVWKFTQQV